jgi:hypothetical protein
MTHLKYLFSFEMPYWVNKGLLVSLYVNYSDKSSCKRLMFSVFYLHKMVDIPGYEDDWGIGECKYYKISEWENK